MKNVLWEIVHDIFGKLDELFGRNRGPCKPEPSDSSLDDAEVGVANPVPTDCTPQYDDLLHARSELRKELGTVRAMLGDLLNERDAYLVLFAITAHFDELVQTRFLKGDELSWPTLQKELFQVDDAGEIFYETLDDILMKPQALPFVLEVYYFCLNDGFKGRYDRNPGKIEEYKQRLRQRIPFETPEQAQCTETEPVMIETKRSPAFYYISAGAVLLAVYLTLMAAGAFWSPLKDF